MKSMTLSNAEIFAARQALAGIDNGHPVKDKDGKVQNEPFNLKGMVRMRLGRLHKRIDDECALLEKTRAQLQAQYKVGGKDTKAEDANEFLREWNAVLHDTKAYDAMPAFTTDELQIECGANNEYPVHVLSGLARFILDKEETAAK